MAKKMRNMTMTNEKIYSIYQTDDNKKLIGFQICGITYPDKNYFISRTNADICCIEFVESGAGAIVFDGVRHLVSEGDSYFLQTGKSQYYYADSEHPWKKYFVNIRGRLLESLIDGYGLRGCAYFPGLNIKHELMDIIKLAKDSEKDHTRQLIAILNIIFEKMRNSLNGETVDPAHKMKDFLDMKVSGSFGMEELCEYISLSNSQAIRVFKKKFGITPYAYFIEQKIRLAKNMLANTNLSIKEIAYNLSFTDAYYFSNAFKDKVGMSPSLYRKRKNEREK